MLTTQQIINKVTTDAGTASTLAVSSLATSALTGQKTINTTAVQMTTTSHQCREGVLVRALDTNTGKVFIGYNSGVTTASGMPLNAGDASSRGIDNPNKIYLVADATGQKVAWEAV